METITISKQEYEKLKMLKNPKDFWHPENYRFSRKFEKVDQELLQDIARGIKDIVEGKIKEV